MIEVYLDEVEAFHAAICGSMRKLQVIYQRIHDKRPGAKTGGDWSGDIESVAAEVAAAKAYKKYYDYSVGTFKHRADIGDTIQVRSSADHNNRLIVRSDDVDDHWFVFVTGTIPNFRVWGHIRGNLAKQPEWIEEYNDDPPAYFVPKEALCPLNKK